MQEILAFAFEAGGAVWHDAFALGGTDLAAEVRLAGFAELAFAAFWSTGERQGLSGERRRARGFLRQTYYRATTLSPGLTDVTPSPTDSTMPAPS